MSSSFSIETSYRQMSASRLGRFFLALLGVKTMAVSPAIQSYVDATTAAFTAIGADLDDLVTKIAALNDTIAKLQATPPVLTAEDQGLLDQAQAQAQALAAKADVVDGKVSSPPTPPVPPSTPPTP